MLIDYELLKVLGVSLGIGMFVGLQREFDDQKMAGIRTFTFVTLFGTVMGFLAQYFDDGIIVAAGVICLGLLLSIVNYYKNKQENPDIGQTTEVAFLLMFALGAYLVIGDLTLGVVLGALIGLLLHLKSNLGNFVDRLKQKDIHAIMQFAAITLVILPLLPNENYGPYDVLNPRSIWMMVVLIVGMGLAGYVIYKLLNKSAGTIINGILGGLISSTATTVTFARRTKDVPNASRLATFIIMAASSVAVVRVLVEVAVVTPQNLGIIAPPLIVEFLFMVILCIGLYFYNKKKNSDELPEPENPAQLTSALIFGFLYAVILLAVAFAKDFFGQSGLYIVSIISGLTDMDAITLSLSSSLNRGEIDAQLTWKLILVASMANLVFKGIMATALGTKALSKFIWIVFGSCIIFGLILIFLWPEGWNFGKLEQIQQIIRE